jgi:hypothetical protein
MPAYLDFDTTNNFRKFILSKTLKPANGPIEFTSSNYGVQNLSDFANVAQPAIDANVPNELTQTSNVNVYKPTDFETYTDLGNLPRRANLQLYPYFVSSDNTLVSIMTNNNFSTESELFKFAASYIKDTTKKGPVYARIAQNIEKTTNGRNRLLDALNGNTATALNLITGREPLVERNYSVTVSPSNRSGVPKNFLDAITAESSPISIIPGNYLTNPNDILSNNPQNPLQLGTILNDATGVIASMIGINGKPKISPRPSDVLINYMGDGQKSILFDLIGRSKYSPNYTVVSQIENTLFNTLNINNFLQIPGTTYIGDDRYDDVKYAMGDFWDNQIRSPYYLAKAFDDVTADIDHTGKELVWVSKNTKNNTAGLSYDTRNVISTGVTFRPDSLLGKTQFILNTKPSNNGEAASHVSQVIDQTSRFFVDGGVKISKGSAVKTLVDKNTNPVGAEFGRVWTKAGTYGTYTNTMRQGSNVRKFDGSVLGGNSRVWNLNYAPMSNGQNDNGITGGSSFANSTNIKDGQAKKYMFSIENLAWKTSTLAGFTVQDLPICERGPNGGRVMWFPPYDLKVSEQNQARWESNAFLGRPEPIYTYQNTERSGQLSFKVVVDHPSVLNLLIREHFKNMDDVTAEEHINAFFAGTENFDFYNLIQTYTVLDKTDIDTLLQYLNANKNPDSVAQNKYLSVPVVKENKSNTDTNATTSVSYSGTFYFPNAVPGTFGSSVTTTQDSYSSVYSSYSGVSSSYKTALQTDLSIVSTGTTAANISDRNSVFGTKTIDITKISDIVNKKLSDVDTIFSGLTNDYNKFITEIASLKELIKINKVKNGVFHVTTTCTPAGETGANFYLGVRRAYSIVYEFLKQISSDGTVKGVKWKNANDLKALTQTGTPTYTTTYTFKELGYENNPDSITITWDTYGEKTPTTTGCNVSFSHTANGGDLNLHAPIAISCRQGELKLTYDKLNDQSAPKPDGSPTTLKVTADDTPPIKKPKPSLDTLKRIVMKTLGECYYFKKLEDTDPFVFDTITKKLKYFHPAFHSTTPEGLNSRLTFLLQCVRPGDTIPIKSSEDTQGINARNTTFGPPPICVLRIGDFYHSKIIIRDVNITYENATWDLNPEGIGVQPMLADVTMQISFIGGQGLEKPVERLQNALSSNFFANTEMYDPRSENTATSISGMTTAEFTQKFIDEMMKKPELQLAKDTQVPGTLTEGTTIGKTVGQTIDYAPLIDTLFKNTNIYAKTYKSVYDSLVKTFGFKIPTIVFSSNYRPLNGYDVLTTSSTSQTIGLLGLYNPSLDLSTLVSKVRDVLHDSVDNTNMLTDIFKVIDRDDQAATDLENIFKPIIKNALDTKMNSILSNKNLKDLEAKRNDIISNLDNLNYIQKFSSGSTAYDAYITGTTYYEVAIDGFDATNFYVNYANDVNYLGGLNNLFNTNLDTSIDWSNVSTLTPQIILEIIPYILKDSINDMITEFKKDGLSEVGNSNGTPYSEVLKINFNSNAPKEITDTKVTLVEPPVRSSTSSISYNAATPNLIDVTDPLGKKPILNILFVDKNNGPTNSKLNYYKVKK